MAMSISENVSKSRLALENCKGSTEIMERMKVNGYTPETMDHGLELVRKAEELDRIQEQEYGDQYAATDALLAGREKVDRVYGKMLAKARLVFEGDRDAYNKLDLAGTRKTRYADWLTQVKTFYSNALADDGICTELAGVGITREALQAGLEAVADVEKVNAIQEKEKGEAQRATEKRDQALDELNTFMSRFRALARIELADDPQLLEQLGL